MKNTKKIKLAASALALSLILSGCGPEPDHPIDIQPSSDVNVLPFDVSTPTPEPTQEAASSGVPVQLVTATPVPGTLATGTPSIVLITATPTIAPPVWTVPPTASPTPTADDGTLRAGDTGADVRALQVALQRLGFYTGNVDGDYGTATLDAVKAFQKANGLTADGVAGARTLQMLNSPTAVSAVTPEPTYAYPTATATPSTYTATSAAYRTLQLGSTGADVLQLQKWLTNLGYFNGNQGTVYDTSTETAVRLFQQRHGLTEDGIAGNDTQRLLYSGNALPYTVLTAAEPTETPEYRLLKNGTSGADVSALQERLGELFYLDPSFVSGTYDNDTENAVRLFQQRNNLTVDGAAGPQTQEILFSEQALAAATAAPVFTVSPQATTLESGSAGEDVQRLQERLYELGYYTGAFTGIYDEATAEAVLAYQQAAGLTADGKAGKRTLQSIYAEDAVLSPSGVPYKTLRLGDEGEEVRAVQSLLLNLGYYNDEITGLYQASTADAVSSFQSYHDLNVTGEANAATQRLLFEGDPAPAPVLPESTPAYKALQRGSQGDDVLQLQQYLQNYGYYNGVLDGTLGAATENALTAFQKANGLDPDGIANSDTLALLYSGNAVRGGQNAESAPRSSLSEGDSGADVFALQQRLTVLGYLSAGADGTYGSATKQAVQAFQQANGLPADGLAGSETLYALYNAKVIAADNARPDTSAVSNRTRELEEQNATGAIQSSIAGGGIAASLNGKVYYTGENGSLCLDDTCIYEGPVKYIHASSKGLTFASENSIVRIDTAGQQQVLCEAGSIRRMELVSDVLYYLDGGALIRRSGTGDTITLAENIQDFCVDVYTYTLYLAGENGLYSMPISGGNTSMLVSSPCTQVQLCDSVLFFRDDSGSLYRLDNGVSTCILEDDASWFAVYRDSLYYICNDRLYACDTTGTNGILFYDGITSSVSFVAGKVYITETEGGAVVATVDAR